MDYMRSSQFLCGPGKVALRQELLQVTELPNARAKRYSRTIRDAIDDVLNGKEGMLLLTQHRSERSDFRDTARTLTDAGWDVEWELERLLGEQTGHVRQKITNRWNGIQEQPNQRIDLPIVADELLITGVSPAYEPWHPRHFPVDALVGTRMSAIHNIAARVQSRIVGVAQDRAGNLYGTANFLPPQVRQESRG